MENENTEPAARASTDVLGSLPETPMRVAPTLAPPTLATAEPPIPTLAPPTLASPTLASPELTTPTLASPELAASDPYRPWQAPSDFPGAIHPGFGDDQSNPGGAAASSVIAGEASPAQPVEPALLADPPDAGRSSGGGKSSWRRGLVVGALIGGLVGAVTSTIVTRVVDRDRDSASLSGVVGGSGLTISQLLRKVGPSVVSVQVGDVRNADVFGGSGTGFVISKAGLILTNAHVVNGAQRIKVGFSDGKLREAKLVGSIPDNDVAIVRLTEVPPSLAVAELGSSDDAVVGDSVVAIGNALNLGASPSVTVGIISATNRSISAENVDLTGLLQTDAAVNPGNSGGPLVNAAGQVIGVVTAIASEGQNIGFALGIDQLKPLITDIEQGRSVINPDTAFLGVRTSGVDELTLGEREALDVKSGAVIVQVVPDSAAKSAGLLPGDVVIEADGATVSKPEDLGAAVRKHKAGEKMVITVRSKSGKRSVTVTLGRTGG